MPNAQPQKQLPGFRPPSVPLVTHDPYFSIWSPFDNLTDGWPTHWTNARHSLSSMIRIDGKTHRLLGNGPREVTPLQQMNLQVLPTQTIYTFQGAGVSVELTFLSPLLPHDLELVSRPVTYITWTVRTIDRKSHQVELFFSAGAEISVHTPDQQVNWGHANIKGLRTMLVGSKDQQMLQKVGDDIRIDWGHLYLATPCAGQDCIGPEGWLREAFVRDGHLPESDDLNMPAIAGNPWTWIQLATTLDIGKVTNKPISRYVMLAYDDQFSVEYFNRKLRPYWRSDEKTTVSQMLQTASAQYLELSETCREYDRDLMKDLIAAGGKHYAELAALAFRQCIAAHKLVVDADGTLLYFSKENFSNGCIGTVDVTYPSSPFFLLFNPELLKAQVTPILNYSVSGRWPHAFAPHDLGTYPHANGQVYGGNVENTENQMPVEECGNLLLIVAALCRAEGETSYAQIHWNVLTQWADYLLEKGFNPDNQLCTDDFAGHLAQNVNLSLKAIVALGAWAGVCDSAGQTKDGHRYRREAKSMAKRWITQSADGDHARLAFDQPGSWSQKYNLVWDQLLELDLFPDSVAKKEVAWYLKKQNEFGLPLDNRATYTKLDWIVWSACLSKSDTDFAALIEPLHHFADRSPSRVPLTDWFDTISGKMVGFQARSVVGGVFMKLLYDEKITKKWRATAK